MQPGSVRAVGTNTLRSAHNAAEFLAAAETALGHPIEIISFWRGGFRGLGIYGAVAGGIVAIVLYTYFTKLNFVRWLDIPTPGLLLAQVIGRIGNFMNQELYGQPTDLPWGLYIPPSHRLPGYDIYERFHPIFFYEAMK